MNRAFPRSFLLGMCLAVSGIAASGVILSGCSDSRDEQLSAAASGLYDTSASITQLKNGVNKTNGALQKLKSGTGSEADYAALKEQIAAIKENAAYIKASHEQMTADTEAVAAKWRDEIAAVKDPVLQKSAAARSANLKESVSQIAAGFGTAKAAYQPYITSLDELTKFLDNDRTPSGVKVAAPAIENSIQGGIAVQGELQKLSGKLDALSGEISPTTK